MNEWKLSVRYCENCGTKIQGCWNNEGKLKIECPKCHTHYSCKIKSRRKQTVEITAPYNEEL